MRILKERIMYKTIFSYLSGNSSHMKKDDLEKKKIINDIKILNKKNWINDTKNRKIWNNMIKNIFINLNQRINISTQKHQSC